MFPYAGVKFPNMLRFLATVRHQLQEEGKPACSLHVCKPIFMSLHNSSAHSQPPAPLLPLPRLPPGVLDLIFGQAGEGSKKQPKAEKTPKLPQKELFEVRLFLKLPLSLLPGCVRSDI
jgi:hypothetical protein